MKFPTTTTKVKSGSSAQPVYRYSFEHEGGWRFGDLMSAPASSVLPRLVMDRMGIEVGGWEERRPLLLL